MTKKLFKGYTKLLQPIKKKGLKGTCTFGIMDSAQGVYYQGHRSCHWDLRNMVVDNDDAVIYNFIHPSPKEVPPQATKLFLDWIINESPYTPIFIKRYQDCVLIDVDQSKTLIASGLIAMRVVSEYFSVLNTWYQLVLAGADKTLAFPIAHSMEVKGEKVWELSGMGHVSFYSPQIDRQLVSNFSKGIYQKDEGFTKNKSGYESINGLFKPKVGSPPIYKELLSNLGEDKRYEDVNPFKRNNNYQKNTASWIEHQKEIVNRINQIGVK